MIAITPSIAATIIKELSINKRLEKRLTFASLSNIPADEWHQRELFALRTKDNGAGILLLQPGDLLLATPFEIQPLSASSTGRTKPIICDFCKTWQTGSRAATITFRPSRRSLNSITLLCCLDLRCSLHVRSQSDAAKMSRAQLREHLTDDERTQRLQQNLELLAERLALRPISQPVD